MNEKPCPIDGDMEEFVIAQVASAEEEKVQELLRTRQDLEEKDIRVEIPVPKRRRTDSESDVEIYEDELIGYPEFSPEEMTWACDYRYPNNELFLELPGGPTPLDPLRRFRTSEPWPQGQLVETPGVLDPRQRVPPPFPPRRYIEEPPAIYSQNAPVSSFYPPVAMSHPPPPPPPEISQFSPSYQWDQPWIRPWILPQAVAPPPPWAPLAAQPAPVAPFFDFTQWSTSPGFHANFTPSIYHPQAPPDYGYFQPAVDPSTSQLQQWPGYAVPTSQYPQPQQSQFDR
jgi:hypothetical protein